MSLWVRILSILLPLGLLIGGLFALILWSRQVDRFPLRAVEIGSELKHVQESDIKAMVSPFLEKGFFWIDVRGVQRSLKQLPWLQSAQVKRVWPDRLKIVVQEQAAQAQWGEEGILSTEGEIFFPEKNSIPAKLPKFLGPEERAKEMLQQYLMLLELLGPLGLTVESLDLSPNGSWQIVLGNGITIILGKSGLNERMGRFVLAYQGSLQAQTAKIAYIDLRYTNGFAIGWKKGVHE